MADIVQFSKGVNFSKWFETRNFDDIIFNKFTEKDFTDIKSLGMDVIRIPIRFHDYTLEKGGNSLNPELFKYLDAAVSWAEKYRIYLILDNHSFHPTDPTDINIDKILIPVWEQIADYYKNKSDYIIFEILNEPHGIPDDVWGTIQGNTIDAIRKYDKNRVIIVGGTNYNSIEKMLLIPEYKEKNLIYTFHFYDPHLFTHQGAMWNKPSLAPLSNVPFPLGDNKLPEIHDTFKSTWVEALIKSYPYDSKPENISASLERAAIFSRERNVPVFCGEFGVFMIQSQREDRVRWYQFICGELEKRKFPWACWDYFGGFGFFKTEWRGEFPSDLDMDIIKAMGLKI